MKKIITLVLLVLSTLSFSQRREEKIEKIKALRIAFISDRLDLTPEEAQKFWPIFNQFEDKHFELRRQKQNLMFQLRPENASSLSDKEVQSLMDQEEKLEIELHNTKKQLAKNLQGVIPNQKIMMLRQLEIEFKQKLLEQIQNRREGKFRR
ncbi:sensor of ECF-type sigma factor [Flavobacterium sp.]|uniref:sensor of ECF-type sigma factor n=1 Tax=Flavobacterium sp. TaxID=239 RepID=UPI003D0BE284